MQRIIEHNKQNSNKIVLERNSDGNYSKKKFLKLVKDTLSFGTIGFASFFLLILVTKIISFLLLFDSELKFDLDDISYSLVGFFLLSLYKLFEHENN